jgi:hypothetical protein
VWQRCYVHFLRNALDYVPRKVDDDCLMELRWFYDRRELAEVRRDLMPLRGIRRTHGEPARCAAAMTTEEIKQLVGSSQALSCRAGISPAVELLRFGGRWLGWRRPKPSPRAVR